MKRIETILKDIQWCLDNNRLPKRSKDKKIWYRLNTRDKFYPYIKKFKESFEKSIEDDVDAKEEIESVIREIKNLLKDCIKKEDPLLIELRNFVDIYKRFPGTTDQGHLRRRIFLALLRGPQLHVSLSKYIQETEIILGCEFRMRENSNEKFLKNYLEWCRKHGYQPSQWREDEMERKLSLRKLFIIHHYPNSLVAKELQKICDKFPNKREFIWNSNFARLQEFIKENNRLPIPSVESEKSMYDWVYRQISLKNLKVLQLVKNLTIPKPQVDMATSLRKFEIYVLTTESFPPRGHSLFQWYYNKYKNKNGLEITEKAKNFWKVFKLSREGNQKAIEIIEAIRKVVFVEDK